MFRTLRKEGIKLDLDSLGNQVINAIDIRDPKAPELVSKFIRAKAEDEFRNLAPSREAAIYNTDLALQAYALWITKPKYKKYRQEYYLQAIEAGVDLYMESDHGKRLKLLEDMSNFQRQLRELVKEYFPNAIDEYEIDGQRIDVYLPDEMLAIEANGEQHYRFCPYFHKTEEDFKKQQYLDKEKERKCKERGITLIRIRYDEELSVKTILAKLMRKG